MTQKNNKEEMFWKEIFSAKDAEKISQEKKLSETIRANLRNGSISQNLSDDSYWAAIAGLRKKNQQTITIRLISIILIGLILVSALSVALLIGSHAIANPWQTPTLTPTLTPIIPTPTNTIEPTPTSTPSPTPMPTSSLPAVLGAEEPVVPVSYDQAWVISGDKVTCVSATSSCEFKMDVPVVSGSYALFYKNDASKDKKANVTFTLNALLQDNTTQPIIAGIGSGTVYLAQNDQISTTYGNKSAWIFVGEYLLANPATIDITFSTNPVVEPDENLASNEMILVHLTAAQIDLLNQSKASGTILTIQDDATFNDATKVTASKDVTCWLGNCSSSTEKKVYYPGIGVMSSGKYHILIYDPLLDLTATPLSIAYYVDANATPIGNLSVVSIDSQKGWYQTDPFTIDSDHLLWFKVTAADKDKNPLDFTTDVLFIVKDAQ